jgi:hypothetical protein
MLKYWGTGYDMCGVWVDDQYKKWVENNKDW